MLLKESKVTKLSHKLMLSQDLWSWQHVEKGLS